MASAPNKGAGKKIPWCRNKNEVEQCDENTNKRRKKMGKHMLHFFRCLHRIKLNKNIKWDSAANYFYSRDKNLPGIGHIFSAETI